MRYFMLFSVLILLSGITQAQSKRLMILVFDQMRYEYIERFDMKNFKRAISLGINFKNGHVGHLESNTIISHPVITNGKFPKNMPWGMHVMRDVDGMLGKKGKFYTPFGLSADWFRLIKQKIGDTSILARIKKKYSGKTYAIAQKKYAAMNFGGPFADTIIALGSVSWEKDIVGRYVPAGVNIPKYITEPRGGRFYIPGTSYWGSDKMVYPFHGNAFIEGNDPKHRGGDVWVGDVVEKIMDNDSSWSAILASFGSIDKVSHVLHEHDEPTKKPWAIGYGINLKDTARKADIEMGRILDRLKSKKILNETTIIITADHGGQHNKFFHGNIKPNAHQGNLFYGKAVNFENLDNYPVKLKKVFETGVVDIASMNTMLSFWLKANPDKSALKKFQTSLMLAPGVIEVYKKVFSNGSFSYQRHYRNKTLKGKALSWAQKRNPPLLDTLASASGPDWIGLLGDRHGYDVPGSHGGAQELVQRIPFIVVSNDIKKKGITASDYNRLVDVNAVAGKLLGLKDDKRIDGTYKSLLPHLKTVAK